MGEPDPEVRPSTDTWPLHVALCIAAGAATGWLVAELTPNCTTQLGCTVGGALCAGAFVPVCLAVIAAGRRAQRARLGSIVAGSDRRAVWGILATLLAVMTVEAAPDWPAYAAGDGPCPCAVLAMISAAAVCIAAILGADVRALGAARHLVARGLAARDGAEAEPNDAAAPRFDLGLGNDLSAQTTRGATAYRHRETTLALVRGTPDLAIRALSRAVRRGAFGLALIGLTAIVHGVASSAPALTTYAITLCGPRQPRACALAASLVEADDPVRASKLLARTHVDDVPQYASE
jgi:hypothetical protein